MADLILRRENSEQGRKSEVKREILRTGAYRSGALNVNWQQALSIVE
jgi:hypothetical protein